MKTQKLQTILALVTVSSMITLQATQQDQRALMQATSQTTVTDNYPELSEGFAALASNVGDVNDRERKYRTFKRGIETYRLQARPFLSAKANSKLTEIHNFYDKAANKLSSHLARAATHSRHASEAIQNAIDQAPIDSKNETTLMNELLQTLGESTVPQTMLNRQRNAQKETAEPAKKKSRIGNDLTLKKPKKTMQKYN